MFDIDRGLLHDENMADLETEIETVADGPAAMSGDAGSMSQHNLKDLIAADRYLQTKGAIRNRRLGIRISRMIPPGAS